MKFHGQLQIDRIIYEKYFLKKKNGFYIECGAYDGKMDSNTLFFHLNLDWKGINIEALPNLFNALQENRKNDINLNFALSDREGTATFTQAVSKNFPYYDGHFGNGSLEHTEVHKKDLLKRNCSFVKYDVKTECLPSLFTKHVEKRPDLFILDVEGHEAKVLSKLSEISEDLHPLVWCVEYGYAGYENILDIMTKNNYSLDYRDRINLLFKKQGVKFD